MSTDDTGQPIDIADRARGGGAGAESLRPEPAGRKTPAPLADASSAPPAAPPAPRPDVARRIVFYIPGYDPMPPRRYRELYRREGAKQAAISGYALELRGDAGAPSGAYGWQVAARIDGRQVAARFVFLEWADLVQRSMNRSIPGTYLTMLRTIWIYLRSGALGRLLGLRKGPVIAALYPVAMLLGQLAVALLAGWGLFLGLRLALPWWLAALPAAALVWGLLAWFRRIDNRLFAHYLMHDYAYSAGRWGANPPELDARLDDFAARIGQALKGDVDEVLVVGHSSGAHLGVEALARLAERSALPEGAQAPKLGFLTLGQVVPMVSFLPRATALRRALRVLSRDPRLTWVDVTAPGDGCTFALCDPVAVSAVAPPDQRWPLVISAAFTRTLSPETWRRLKRRFFRLHFQYLCAFDRPGDYDYFQITAGPLSLARRFAGRRPSPSRIARPCSPHRSTGAPEERGLP